MHSLPPLQRFKKLLRGTRTIKPPLAEGFRSQAPAMAPPQFRPPTAAGDRSSPPLKRPRGTDHHPVSMFFKTRLCPRLAAGACSYGERCTYAHGAHELRKPVCRRFYNGEVCPYGDRCSYLHDHRGGRPVHELRKFGDQRQLDSMDAVIAINRLPNPIKDVLSPSDPMKDVLPSKEVAFKHEAQQKGVPENRWPKKLSGIYGDWLDHIPFVRTSSGKADTCI